MGVAGTALPLWEEFLVIAARRPQVLSPQRRSDAAAAVMLLSNTFVVSFPVWVVCVCKGGWGMGGRGRDRW